MQNYHLKSSKQLMAQSIIEEDIARTEIEKIIQKFESILSPHLSESNRNDLRRMMLLQIHQFHRDIMKQIDMIQRDNQKNSHSVTVSKLGSTFKAVSRMKMESLSSQ